MTVTRLVCLAGLTLWRVLAVAGVFLLMMVPPSPSPPSSLQTSSTCDRRLSSVARRIVHQVRVSSDHSLLSSPDSPPRHHWAGARGEAPVPVSAPPAEGRVRSGRAGQAQLQGQPLDLLPVREVLHWRVRPGEPHPPPTPRPLGQQGLHRLPGGLV